LIGNEGKMDILRTAKKRKLKDMVQGPRWHYG